MNTLRAWARDLSLGARFAFGGGRQGWTRTLLTGVGVGLGVALLLIGTAVPGALTDRHEREDARSLLGATTADAPGRDTLLVARVDQTYRHQDIGGRLLRAEGPDAPVPPGLKALPKAGEMAVSPALERLLASPEGADLRERLGARITATVADRGLTGPAELLFYLGSDSLQRGGPGEYRIQRITAFAGDREPRALGPGLMLLVVLAFVALLTPVAVFIAAAVRFGGERRDQRLAALRLVGADGRTVRRIAAGEALSGALVGLVLGAGFFLAGRSLVGSLSFQQRSVFPEDLDPSAWLLLLVALAVPAAAVAVTVPAAVAVAGAIALQMVFTGVEEDYERPTGQDPGRAAVSVMMHMGTESRLDALARELAATPGVVRAVPLTGFQAARSTPADGQTIRGTIGTCDALREVADIGACAEGDAFVLSGGGLSPTGEPLAPVPGERLYAGNITSFGARELPAQKPVEWAVPAGARTVRAVPDPMGDLREGVLVTPSAAPREMGSWPTAQVYLQTDESRPDTLDRIRTAVFRAEPLAKATTLRESSEDTSYAAIRTGLFFGAAALLVLIGTSMLVSQLEQLRERRRLLAALVAFGTPRGTLGLSVLWQTALPIALGLSLATGTGLALGSALLWVAGRPVHVDWTSVLALAGAGVGVVALVTLLTLPPLLRMMRPDGLRTE
ncbi:FtsX-like permease family protein [Streptomyces katrae]|uniref:ABC3 transporter permease C-terminal domain-containing protein n=1 Tax=Streptomyces katrae TaxID=68223 RepID=A0A0F4JC70_9ACTN|nr:FtsX-like permease family protein [Streptomyces katrae]KJY31805.1 hypothetical protein VR44_17430 [Streptomyces katrae]